MAAFRPNPTNITPKAEELLRLIRIEGGWVTRTAIAEQLGKKRLNKWDTGLLELLTKEGLIEAKQEPDTSSIGWHWEHRAVPQ